jgi:hypothetical protein
MAPSQEEKSHTNGAQEITKSVNRWNLCLPVPKHSVGSLREIFISVAHSVRAGPGTLRALRS